MRVGDLVLTPVEQVSVRGYAVARSAFFSGSKRPIAVEVSQQGREWRIEIPHGG